MANSRLLVVMIVLLTIPISLGSATNFSLSFDNTIENHPQADMIKDAIEQGFAILLGWNTYTSVSSISVGNLIQFQESHSIIDIEIQIDDSISSHQVVIEKITDKLPRRHIIDALIDQLQYDIPYATDTHITIDYVHKGSFSALVEKDVIDNMPSRVAVIDAGEKVLALLAVAAVHELPEKDVIEFHQLWSKQPLLVGMPISLEISPWEFTGGISVSTIRIGGFAGASRSLRRYPFSFETRLSVSIPYALFSGLSSADASVQFGIGALLPLSFIGGTTRSWYDDTALRFVVLAGCGLNIENSNILLLYGVDTICTIEYRISENLFFATGVGYKVWAAVDSSQMRDYLSGIDRWSVQSMVGWKW